MWKRRVQRENMVVRVRREVAILAELSHPNIVALREVLVSSRKLYVVMELVDGFELTDELARHPKGVVPEQLARCLFSQLVDAVDYCHRRGVCHRDLKAENIMVTRAAPDPRDSSRSTPRLKLLDFGVSSLMYAGTDAKSSMARSSSTRLCHTQCGSPYYCAPEVLLQEEGGYAAAKADAWSCGVLLYLMLTGRLPFQSDWSDELLAQIAQASPKYDDFELSDAALDLLQRLLDDVRDSELLSETSGSTGGSKSELIVSTSFLGRALSKFHVRIVFVLSEIS
eukprot:CAMPEP_0185839340 /NCGR_PEP_ID=MMETSP1353-20130828/14436_1 /TAXON_ID=1077150 /ORGANISM="Erythrolobus australicus, Strain CCMP3124" /LENGTH=281 /DNA_ID=CAMNT_0028538487 /DNA_START=366 /DNA_END=1212 /DNA_ORIENTATION=+